MRALVEAALQRADVQRKAAAGRDGDRKGAGCGSDSGSGADSDGDQDTDDDDVDDDEDVDIDSVTPLLQYPELPANVPPSAEHIDSLHAAPPVHDLFRSHKRLDTQDFARALKETLSLKYGYGCFLDQNDGRCG